MVKAKKEVKELQLKEVNLDSIKKELTKYIDDQIKANFNEEVEKANKRLIREKNKKIVFRNIVILILIGIIGFLLFIMYRNGYFSKILNAGEKTEIQEKDNKENNSKEEKQEEPKEIKPTLEELKQKYEKLLDPYTITSLCDYKEDLYSGNLSSNLRKYMTLNTIDFKSIVSEDYNIINENTFKKAFETLFTSGYEKGSFNYNENHIRYIPQLETYMSDKLLERGEYDLVREIISIEENEEKVFITTIEGVLKNNHLFNILTLEEVPSFNGGSILNYQDKLNKITYIFEKEKLVDLKK